ncbi:unnamed protein product [Heligmosomoides polygyrus]|uniref:Peptidase A2 domain-containing protein n=1 Tax=Heligmosomoides polygyrus TaxID=6339 RepID=A0A183FL12_HELPZ|nr:unnamed protein product [Heligmosomoides polygyrus]
MSAAMVVKSANETLRGTTADSSENHVPAEVSNLRVAIRDIASCVEEQLDQQLRGLPRKKRDIVLKELRNAVSMAEAKMESAFQHAVVLTAQQPGWSEQRRQSGQGAREEITEAGTVSLGKRRSSRGGVALREAFVTLIKHMGKQCYREIELLGQTAEALVDTGSVVSIIRTVMLNKAKDRGTDIDGIVVEAGDPNKHRVCDASGNPMKFLKVI